MDYKDGCIRFHRAEFLDVFVNHLPEGVAHFGKRLSSYSQNFSDGELQLDFSDGSTASCDVLIGCDGIKSTIRKQLFESLAETESPDYLQYIDPIWSGSTAYRGLIPVDELIDRSNGKMHRTISTPMMVTVLLLFLDSFIHCEHFRSTVERARSAP